MDDRRRAGDRDPDHRDPEAHAEAVRRDRRIADCGGRVTEARRAQRGWRSRRRR
jgi:acyl dehydratase